MKKLYITILFLSMIGSLQAQKATLIGKVIDAKNGDPLIGVTVLIKGTTIGVSTDLDGKYQLKNLDPGTYAIEVRYISYKTKIIEGVTVKADELKTLNVNLQENTSDLKEVLIVSSYNRESSAVQLMEQKNASTVSDGISADIIRKTPDNAASDVMKRVSGTSIQDNKFAVIRGLNDRYNMALVNGSPLPSTESDRRAFAFDLFPSNLLDGITIYKTASPDLPAEFAGGLIVINTKDIPEENFFNIQIGGGFNAITTFRNNLTYEGGKNDWLGFDGGHRALPSEVPTTEEFRSWSNSNPNKLTASRAFSNSWKTEYQNTPMNNSFQAVFSRKWTYKKSNFGVIASATRNENFRFSEVIRNAFVAPDNIQPFYNLVDSVTKREVLTGFMVNTGIKIGLKHKITFKNTLTVNGEDQTIRRNGRINLDEPTNISNLRGTGMWYQDNTLLTSQLIGEHTFFKRNHRLKWNYGYSELERNMPDFRRVVYNQNSANPDSPFAAQIGNNVQPSQAGRFFSTLNEQIRNAALDYTMPLNSDSSKNKTTVKAGLYWQNRDRIFNARTFGYIFSPGPGVNPNIRNYGLDSIFAPDNLKFQNGRFFLIDEATNPSDRYSATSATNAAYIMLDQKLLKKLRLVYGMRWEQFTQRLNSRGPNGDSVKVNNIKNDFLPSINVTYELTEKSNLRAGASRTVSRPEFREIAPFAFYDFNIDYVVTGNPTLRRASIENFDLKYEYFPGGNQIISASAFYKNFNDAIEFINDLDVGAGSRRFGYQNIERARNYGFELELRKNFGFLKKFTDKNWINQLLFIGNFAYIFSEIDLRALGLAAASETRPLQGQSPYLINGGLQYNNAESGWGYSLMVNRVGRRIAFVGNVGVPDIYENPRTVIDLQVAKTIKKLSLKLNIGDILAQEQTFYMDMDKNGRFDAEKDNVIFQYTFGLQASFSVGYRF